MKIFITIFLIVIGLAIVLWGGAKDGQMINQIRTLQFQHTRYSLIIDSMRNPVDTTQFLIDHSELKR